jgi:hypothetical protein
VEAVQTQTAVIPHCRVESFPFPLQVGGGVGLPILQRQEVQVVAVALITLLHLAVQTVLQAKEIEEEMV